MLHTVALSSLVCLTTSQSTATPQTPQWVLLSGPCAVTTGGLCIIDRVGSYGSSDRCQFVYYGPTTTINSVQFSLGCDRRKRSLADRHRHRHRRDGCSTLSFYRGWLSTTTTRFNNNDLIRNFEVRNGASASFDADDETGSGFVICTTTFAPTAVPTSRRLHQPRHPQPGHPRHSPLPIRPVCPPSLRHLCRRLHRSTLSHLIRPLPIPQR